MHVCPLLGIVCRQKVCYFLNVLIVEETSIYSELYMFKLEKKTKKKQMLLKEWLNSHINFTPYNYCKAHSYVVT